MVSLKTLLHWKQETREKKEPGQNIDRDSLILCRCLDGWPFIFLAWMGGYKRARPSSLRIFHSPPFSSILLRFFVECCFLPSSSSSSSSSSSASSTSSSSLTAAAAAAAPTTRNCAINHRLVSPVDPPLISLALLHRARILLPESGSEEEGLGGGGGVRGSQGEEPEDERSRSWKHPEREKERERERRRRRVGGGKNPSGAEHPDAFSRRGGGWTMKGGGGWTCTYFDWPIHPLSMRP